MKRIVIVLALLATMYAQAQVERPAIDELPRNAVSVSFLGPVISAPMVTYERHLSPRWALEAHVCGVFPRGEAPNGATLALDARWYFGYSFPVLFFVEGGVYGAGAWFTRDVFTGNDGFDIHTARHTYSSYAMRPSLMGGFRLQDSHGIFAELRVGVVPDLSGIDNILRAVTDRSITATYFGVKLGWAF